MCFRIPMLYMNILWTFYVRFTHIHIMGMLHCVALVYGFFTLQIEKMSMVASLTKWWRCASLRILLLIYLMHDYRYKLLILLTFTFWLIGSEICFLSFVFSLFKSWWFKDFIFILLAVDKNKFIQSVSLLNLTCYYSCRELVKYQP